MCFPKIELAKKVLEEMRFPTIRGHKTRALPFVDLRLSKSENEKGIQLFVKNVPEDWNHEDLYNNFKEFGKVLSCKLAIDVQHKNKGYGFVQFENVATGRKAIEDLHDSPLSRFSRNQNEAEIKMQVCEFVAKENREVVAKPKCKTNLYVKNFPTVVKDSEGNERPFSDDDLEKLFAD